MVATTRQDRDIMKSKIRERKQIVTAMIESKKYSREACKELVVMNSKLSDLIARLNRPDRDDIKEYHKVKKEFSSFVEDFERRNSI